MYGNIYHIIHGVKSAVFNESHDKLKFLECMGAAKEKYDFLLLAYCIMDDHYHLVIKAHNIPISKIMQSINTCFGIYYSRIHKESPFKARYKSIVIQDKELANIINLIHREPIYNNLADSMEEYPYSSHAFYLMNVDSLVDIDYLFNILSPDRNLAMKEYSNAMEESPRDYKELDSKKIMKELDKILRKICPNDIDFDLIKKGSKKSYLMDYKKKFIEEAKSLAYSSKEIGDCINISDRAVRKHLED